MRKRSAPPHENHDRWLVSYADFITLLFAFFVVMFASSQADREKAKAVSESVREALKNGQLTAAISTMLGRGTHDAKKPPLSKVPTNSHENPPSPATAKSQSPDLAEYFEMLSKGLEAEMKSGKLQLKLESRGLVISLREATFFASGDETITPDCMPILARIAEVVRELPNPVRLEGHTDALPIHNLRFRSNWELSTARSIALLQVLRDRFGIDQTRMAVAGYAANVPADTNETEEGRRRNRRVDLVLLSPGGLRSEPAEGSHQ